MQVGCGILLVGMPWLCPCQACCISYRVCLEHHVDEKTLLSIEWWLSGVYVADTDFGASVAKACSQGQTSGSHPEVGQSTNSWTVGRMSFSGSGLMGHVLPPVCHF